MSGVLLTQGATSSIQKGGISIVAVYGGIQGAIIWNPLTAVDQGLSTAELLYVDATGAAGLIENQTCVALVPGQFYFAPPNDATNIWVNAATGGHKFTCIIIQPAIQFPPTPLIGTFPPAGPTSLTTTLPSYLYQQYTDDDSLQAFVLSYNSLTQEYVDWFNSINLPIYTQPQIYGALLDWVASGIYGITRPTLSSGRPAVIGPYNTFSYNQRGIGYNLVRHPGPANVAATSDDLFKRIITWHFYKGDGKYMGTRWLKRRIARFLFGANGTDFEGNTYQISVLFGINRELNITILSGMRTMAYGFVYNRVPGLSGHGSYYNKNRNGYNSFGSSFASYAVPAFAILFKEAVDTGALEMPFSVSPIIVNIYPRGTIP